MKSKVLIHEAKSFYNAYIALEQLQEQEPEPLLLYVPTIVNGAFAVELALKAILSDLNIHYEKEHNLLSLFELLPEELKKLFWKYLVMKAPEFENHQHQIEELTIISNAFVDMRYYYEVDVVPAINTRFLSAFANAAIYMMFGLGLNVSLVEIEKEKSDPEIEKMFEENNKKYIKKMDESIRKRRK